MSGFAQMLRRLAVCRRGSALPEFGLVLPVMMLLLIGGLDFGIAVYEHMDVRAAARAGAEYARQNPTDTAGIQQTALDALGGLSGSASVAATTFCECADGSAIACTDYCPGGDTPRRFITVQVTEQHAMLIPYPGLSDGLELRSLATFRLQ